MFDPYGLDPVKQLLVYKKGDAFILKILIIFFRLIQSHSQFDPASSLGFDDSYGRSHILFNKKCFDLFLCLF